MPFRRGFHGRRRFDPYNRQTPVFGRHSGRVSFGSGGGGIFGIDS